MTKSKFVLLTPVLALLAGVALQGCGNSNSGAAGSGGQGGSVVSAGTGGSVGTGGSLGGGGSAGGASAPKVTIVGSGS